MAGLLTTVPGVPTRSRQCIHAKEQDQNIRNTAHPDEAHHIPQPARGGAHGEQHGQRAQAECLACHKPLDKVSYTFTLKQIAAAK